MLISDQIEHVGLPVVKIRFGRTSDSRTSPDFHNSVLTKNRITFFRHGLSHLILHPKKPKERIGYEFLKRSQLFVADAVYDQSHYLDQSVNQESIVLHGVLLLLNWVSDTAEVP